MQYVAAAARDEKEKMRVVETDEKRKLRVTEIELCFPGLHGPGWL